MISLPSKDFQRTSSGSTNRVAGMPPVSLAVQRAGVVHPIRALPPHVVHPLAALRVHHVPTLLLGESVGQSNREGALFGVAEYYRKLRVQGDVEVDGHR